MILTRMIGMLGPIDPEMLETGQETHKYFTEEYDLYHLNEVCQISFSLRIDEDWQTVELFTFMHSEYVFGT